ncbi:MULTISPECIES: hypothetical protein [unclassified Frankia]|uniref:hypothetical protein n=1 Tax=unclassified Frankia TaxID=2632575 RepID=UPI002AD4A1CC|nr:MULTISPECIES: hypothetical protein [unclassified Frankia]
MIVDWTEEFDRWLAHAEEQGGRLLTVAIALIGFDKKTIGDVFYTSAAARGEALIDAWLRQKGGPDDR